MNIYQLKNSIYDLPEDAEVYCSNGDPFPNSQCGAYKTYYDHDNNIFYIQYMERGKK